MKLPSFALFAVAALAFGLSGCATRAPAPTPQPVVQAKVGWLRTELYFSLGEWAETAFSTDAENKWGAFLDSEVTPRFPDGLSVVDVYGQWRDAATDSITRRERSRLLVIVHPDEASIAAKIEELRNAWKTRTGEKLVLKVSLPANVSF